MATTQQLEVTLSFSDDSTEDVTGEATYSSDDTAVATVDSSGLITAVDEGTCTITVEYGDFDGTCTVTVDPVVE